MRGRSATIGPPAGYTCAVMKSAGRGAQAARSGGDEPSAADPGARRSWKDAWPFWVALAVIVIGGLAIGLSYAFKPSGERGGDSAKVQYAINDAYTARNALNYDKYRGAHCAADLRAPGFPGREAFVADNRRSRDADGTIVIPEITDLTVHGDRADAKVHWHFDKHPDAKQTTQVSVVRENGSWKVCTR